MLKSRQDFRMYCYSTYQKSFLPAIFFAPSSQADKNARNNTYIFQHKRIQFLKYAKRATLHGLWSFWVTIKVLESYLFVLSFLHLAFRIIQTTIKEQRGNCLIPANFKFSWCISFVNLWENLFLREIYLEGPNNLNTTCHYLISLNYVKTTVKETFFKFPLVSHTCAKYCSVNLQQVFMAFATFVFIVGKTILHHC